MPVAKPGTGRVPANSPEGNPTVPVPRPDSVHETLDSDPSIGTTATVPAPDVIPRPLVPEPELASFKTLEFPDCSQIFPLFRDSMKRSRLPDPLALLVPMITDDPPAPTESKLLLALLPIWNRPLAPFG